MEPSTTRKPRKLKSMDLFCGIGGMTRALHEISTPILYCDKLQEAQEVIRANIKKGSLPAAPIIADVRDLRKIPASAVQCDLVCAGFPCIGFSSLGLREGFEHKETAIYHELVNVIDRFRPPMVFMENVPLIIKAIPVIQKDFAKMNYNLVWIVIRACNVGAPQQRARWYCLAYNPKDILKLRIGELKTPVFNWDTPEPAKTTNRPYLPMRVKLLGNSLVPEAARVAFKYLSRLAQTLAAHGIMEGARPPMKSDRFLKYGFTIKNQLYVIPKAWRPQLAVCKPRPFVLDPAMYTPSKPRIRVKHFSGYITEPFVKNFYATPRYGNCYYMAQRLTRRSKNDLGTQLRYMRNNEYPKGKYVNVHFVEWLMGFPKDWTEFNSQAVV